MITSAARIGLFQATVQLFGRRRARRLQAKWREALADPDLIADLTVLGYLGEAHVAGDGSALSALDTARREGARQLALAILARAQITEAEISEAMEALNHEPPDDVLEIDDLPDRPGR